MRRTAMMLIVTMAFLSCIPRVEAAFIASDESFAEVTPQKDMRIIQRTLEHKLVLERLSALGYSQAEIANRLAQLSDAERHQLATQIESLAPAGDGLGIVIALLVIVLLVILILKLVDKKIVIG